MSAPCGQSLPLSLIRLRESAELIEMEKTIKLMPTKAGKGYKIVVDGVWFYTSIGEITKMLAGKVAACQFRGIVEESPIVDFAEKIEAEEMASP